MGQMTADQYLDQIQNQLMKTLTEKKDAIRSELYHSDPGHDEGLQEKRTAPDG